MEELEQVVDNLNKSIATTVNDETVIMKKLKLINIHK